MAQQADKRMDGITRKSRPASAEAHEAPDRPMSDTPARESKGRHPVNPFSDVFLRTHPAEAEPLVEQVIVEQIAQVKSPPAKSGNA
jgi:hypothetical protein